MSDGQTVKVTRRLRDGRYEGVDADGRTVIFSAEDVEGPAETAAPRSAWDRVLDLLPSHARTGVDVGVGAAKGAGRTIFNLGSLAHRVPGLRQLGDAIQPGAFDRVPAMLDPSNTAQAVGMTGEQIGEFFLPSGATTRTALQIASRLPRLPSVVARMGAEAASAGGVTAAQGGDIAHGAALGGGAPLVPVGMRGAMNVGRAGVRGAMNVWRRMATNQTPMERAAVAFGRSRNVPIDAATETGSPFVQAVQKNVTDTLGGANVAERFKADQASALARVGDELATETNAATGVGAVTPVRAGERVTQAVERRIAALDADADDAYERLRTIAAQRRETRARQPGGKFESMELPVDLRSVKQQLQPIYQELKREAELVPLQGGKARALVALDRLVSASDFAPLLTVDKALGELKALARGAALPALRSEAQGIAAAAVKELDAIVQRTAAKAGPDAIAALQTGRRATIAKYAAAEVYDLLHAEPRQVFTQLTARKDAGLERLRAVQQIAPNEMPQVARAFLEDLMDLATAEGGFGHADKLWAEWQKLGAATKAVLFPSAGHVKNLNEFFLLAKRIGENPNPSGTARVLNATKVLSAPVMNGLARLLYAPDTARQATTALRSGRLDAVFSTAGRSAAALASQRQMSRQ